MGAVMGIEAITVEATDMAALAITPGLRLGQGRMMAFWAGSLAASLAVLSRANHPRPLMSSCQPRPLTSSTHRGSKMFGWIREKVGENPGMTVGMVIGGAVGSALGPLGTITGAGIGASIGNNYDKPKGVK
jgi:hypothetical protein